MKLITWILVFSDAGASSSLSVAQEAAAGADALAASTTLSGYVSTTTIPSRNGRIVLNMIGGS